MPNLERVWLGVVWVLLALVALVTAATVYRVAQPLLQTGQPVLPQILSVRALHLGEGETLPVAPSIVDGVNVEDTDRVLVMKPTPSVWVLSRTGWRRTRHLMHMAPGSVVQVDRGFRFVHASFTLRGQQRLVPLWQHWFLKDESPDAALDQPFVLQARADRAAVSPVAWHDLSK
jgi:hypothetical protein